MRDELPSESRLCFDAYQVDLRTGELRKHGTKVHLAGRPFQILALLLEQPGELLTRKELQSRLWPADTFVDFESDARYSPTRARKAVSVSGSIPLAKAAALLTVSMPEMAATVAETSGGWRKNR